MSIVKIETVVREGARVIIMLCGVSGGGKTRTAIELAYGMVGGDGSKVGFLDAENGRGKMYADDVPTPYLYGELRPPFSPARYVQAIDEFAKTGIEVLIIDSGSHEFEGIGGVQEIAEAGNPRMPNWNKAKAEHKKFMSAMLNAPMHIILCLRAREKAKPEKQVVDGREKTVYVDMGLQPITEKNVVFEATASLMLSDNGKHQEIIKCPSALLPILGRGKGHISQADGQRLRAWIDGAQQLDPEVERHRVLLNAAAEKGMSALVKQWGDTPKNVKAAIGPNGCPEEMKASAKAFDDQVAAEAAAKAQQGQENAALGALNQAVAEQADKPQQAAQDGEPKTDPAKATREAPAQQDTPDTLAGADGEIQF